MAKHAAKQNEVKGLTASRDAVGWGFWLIACAALYGPAWYLAYQSVYESDRDGFVPWVIALTLAAVGAGLLSFAVNTTLRKRAVSAKRQARHDKKKQAAKK